MSEQISKQAKIYVAGHQGLVGSAIMRLLNSRGYSSVVTRTFAQLNLCDQSATNQFFAQERPEYVIVAAARVGGIKANNDYPAQFIYDNLMIASNVIHAAYQQGVTKLLFLGSSCIYPRLCEQPIKEEYLLTGPLEPTNEPYAIAKIAGLKLCESYQRQYGAQFISAMPTNLYGTGDNFDLNNSHVIPALIAKIHRAKIEGSSEVTVWGTGKARREFLFVDDLAQALLFLLENYQGLSTLNVGTGQDITIADLAALIKDVVGFEGKLVFDTSKPDGTPQKLLDVTKLNQLGWKAQTSLEVGLRKTYEWYLQNSGMNGQIIRPNFDRSNVTS
jgi:GDP-L-fucose synthase